MFILLVGRYWLLDKNELFRLLCEDLEDFLFRGDF